MDGRLCARPADLEHARILTPESTVLEAQTRGWGMGADSMKGSMIDYGDAHRAVPVSRARRELTSILRRAEPVRLTLLGVPVAELVPERDTFIEEARASTQRTAGLYPRVSTQGAVQDGSLKVGETPATQ